MSRQFDSAPVHKSLTATNPFHNAPIHHDGSRKALALQSAHPNPYNPLITITYDIASPSMVSLIIFDVLGKEVPPLLNEVKSPGRSQVQWESNNVATGQYACRLTQMNAMRLTLCHK